MFEYVAGLVKTTKGKYAVIAVAVVTLLLAFVMLTRFPLLTDIANFGKGIFASWDRKDWENDVKALQKSIDSTKTVMDSLKQSTASLQVRIDDVDAVNSRRGRVIDSLRLRVTILNGKVIALKNKKEVVDEDITDVNRFVDSVLRTRVHTP